MNVQFQIVAEERRRISGPWDEPIKSGATCRSLTVLL